MLYTARKGGILMPSYGSDADMIAFLAETGRVVPAGMTVTVARAWGSKYVNLFESKYMGQALALPDSFPRDLWPTVPPSVEQAAYEAGYAYANGVDLFGGGGGSVLGRVIKEKVDVLELSYSDKQSETQQGFFEDGLYILQEAYALLLPFMRRSRFSASAFVVGGNRCGC